MCCLKWATVCIINHCSCFVALLAMLQQAVQRIPMSALHIVLCLWRLWWLINDSVPFTYGKITYVKICTYVSKIKYVRTLELRLHWTDHVYCLSWMRYVIGLMIVIAMMTIKKLSRVSLTWFICKNSYIFSILHVLVDDHVRLLHTAFIHSCHVWFLTEFLFL